MVRQESTWLEGEDLRGYKIRFLRHRGSAALNFMREIVPASSGWQGVGAAGQVRYSQG